MSADNGIYILKTLRPKNAKLQFDGYEYRVAHLQAVENYQWDDKKKNPDKSYVGDYTDDADVQIKNARQMWKGCTVFADRDAAWAEAQRRYDEIMQDDFCSIVEYGIQEIFIPRVFTKPRKRRAK